MWVICWEDDFCVKLWEVVSGEDAMQQRVDQIMKSGRCGRYCCGRGS